MKTLIKIYRLIFAYRLLKAVEQIDGMVIGGCVTKPIKAVTKVILK